MQQVRLLVFGKRWDAQRADAGAPWTLTELTGEGKRVPLGWVVPGIIPASEVATYIADLLHEVVPARGDDRIVRLPDA